VTSVVFQCPCGESLASDAEVVALRKDDVQAQGVSEIRGGTTAYGHPHHEGLARGLGYIVVGRGVLNELEVQRNPNLK
jgi:hypothetical protein